MYFYPSPPNHSPTYPAAQSIEWQRPGQPGWQLFGQPAAAALLAPRGESLLSHSDKRFGRTQNSRSTVSFFC